MFIGYLCWVDGCSLACSCLAVFDLLWFAGVFWLLTYGRWGLRSCWVAALRGFLFGVGVYGGFLD